MLLSLALIVAVLCLPLWSNPARHYSNDPGIPQLLPPLPPSPSLAHHDE
jgi:hypothetical protein